jgi:probable rRNA maturation factor
LTRGAKIELSVVVDKPTWRKTWPSLKTDIAELLRVAANHPDLVAKSVGVVSIVLADDETLRRLNREFRGKDRPTNVLSFADPSEPLGGIAVAYETVARETLAQNKKFVNHCKHMILHGFLHLLGYDHVAKKATRLMEEIEIAILRDVGIPNPYVIETKPSA